MKFKICHKIICSVISLVILCVASEKTWADEWKLTLNKAIERAIGENRNIQIAKQRLVELAGLKGEARAIGLPQFTGTASYTHAFRKQEISIANVTYSVGKTNVYVGEANFNQLLWNGGKVFKAVKAAKAEELRGIESVRDMEEKIRLEVKQTFHEILYTEKVIGVLEKQLKVLEEHLNSIKKRFKEGIDSDYTLMRQEVEVSNIKPDLIDAKRNRELLINGMKVLLVIPPSDIFSPEGEFDYQLKTLPNMESLVMKAVENRPDLKVEKLRVRSLSQMIGVEKADWWPSVGLTGTFAWQGQTDHWRPAPDEQTLSFLGGASLTWPIFDGLKIASRVKQARARLMQQQFATSQMEDEVVREVKDLHETLARARESLNTQRKSLELARKATAIAGERFESGLMSQIELNDTITSQSRAEQQFLRALSDCLNSEAALEKAVGGEI